jgi:hypothetical protein
MRSVARIRNLTDEFFANISTAIDLKTISEMDFRRASAQRSSGSS